MKAQLSHYRQERCHRGELIEWIDKIRNNLEYGARPIKLRVGFGPSIGTLE